MTTPAADYWNHNVHYQRVITGAVPPGCGAAIDVGCGDGLLVRQLAGRCRTVTGIDADPPMIARARSLTPLSSGTVTFLQGDFLRYPLEDERYDFACAVTSLHHMDFAAALARMARLLRPGGRLAVVGLGARGSAADLVIDAAAIPVNRWYQRTRGEGGPGAPVRDPDLTWAQTRTTARRVLPGVRYRRRLLWRYSLIWDKPAG